MDDFRTQMISSTLRPAGESSGKDTFKIQMTGPSGRQGEVTRDKLNSALENGFKFANPEQKFKMTSPSGKEGLVKAVNLPSAFENNFQLASPGLGDRVKEVGQGVARAFGGTADFINKHLNAPLLAGANLVGLQEHAERASNSNLAEELPRIGLLQTHTQPDKTSAVLKAAGSTGFDLLPFAAAGKGVQLLTKAGRVANVGWVNKLNRFLSIDVNAKNAASFAAMGAGGELARSDDPDTGELENIAREVVGSIAGGITIPAASSAAVKGIYNVFRHPIETAQNIGTSVLATATGGNINKEAVAAAKKLGLHLPPSLATDSRLAKAIENTALKSYFTSQAYNEVIEKIPQKIIREIEHNLDEIGTRIASTGSESGSQIASGNYKAALESNREAWKEQSTTLFDNALETLTENDVMAVPETLKTVREMISDLTKSVRAAAGGKKAVLDNLTELEQAIITNEGKLPVRNLVGEQQDLLNLGKYGETTGYENFYNGVAGVLTDEISTYQGNKIFTENYLPARAFYKEHIIGKLRTDTAKNILEGKFPKGAFEFMTTPKGVAELEHILGNHANAKEIMGTLKRAKISNLLVDGGVISPAGEFNSGAFMRMFGRESKEPLLKSLMGSNFDTVQKNITPLAEALQSSGKVLANPSGSANVIKDYGIIANTAVGIGTAAATGSVPAAALAAGGGAALINLVSRAFASPKYLEKLINRSNRLEAFAKIKKDPREAVMKAGQAIANSPVTKYQTFNYGLNEALPTGLNMSSDVLFGTDFTNRVKGKFEEAKKNKK